MTLGGHTADWWLDGSEGLNQWLRRGHWHREGGLKLVHCAADLIPLIAERLEELCREGMHRQDVRVHALSVAGSERENEGGTGSPSAIIEAIEGCLGIDPAASRVKRLMEAGNRIRLRPTALVLRTNRATMVVEQLDRWIDAVEKLGGTQRPAIVLLSDTIATTLATTYRLQRGHPLAVELCDVDLTTSECWRRYLHHRIAFETGGRLDQSRRWASDLDGLRHRVGDDDSLERGLNHLASTRFADVDESLRHSFLESLMGIASEPSMPADRWALEAENLVIRANDPTSTSAWAARAVLLAQREHAASDHLRWAMSCQPLAQQMLSRCFVLEARHRVECYRDMPGTDLADDQSHRDYQKISTEELRESTRLLPLECPATVRNVWQAASFGVILDRTRIERGMRHHDRHSIRTLRNRLAHGHYPSWRMLTRLRGLLARL